MNLQIHTMTERPDKRTLITTGCYWLVSFFLLPIFLLYLCFGFYESAPVLGWVQVCYYAVNALCTFFIFREHLADGWFTFRIDPKKVWTTVFVCAGIFIVFFTAVMLLGTVPGWSALQQIHYAVPVSELELMMLPMQLVQTNPIFGTVSLLLFTPLTVSCLLYGLGFSPACNAHPVLGYMAALAVLGLHRALNYYTVGTIQLEQMLYLAQLPAHLLACAAYHRTDTVIAPILFHMVINLLACLLILL